MDEVRIPARSAEVIADVDVVVCGAGPAGLGAAMAAARTGARVAIVERYGFLGGNLTAAAVGTMCGLYLRTAPAEYDLVTGGLARRFADGLSAAGAGLGPYPFKDTAVLLYVPWAAKRLADHWVTESDEADRMTVLLHAFVSDVVLDDRGDVAAVIVASKQGPKAIVARVVVDATGDADIAAAAGVPWAVGGQGERQFGAMQFFLQHVDVDAAMAAGLGALAAAIEAHGHHLTRDGGALIPTFRPGEVIGAMIRLSRDGAALDGTDLVDLTFGELEGRRRAEEAAAFVRDHVPGFADSYLADTAVQQGVRETRHILGQYTLTGGDVTGLARFPDAIGTAAWPQEFHVSGRGTEYRFLPDASSYQLPYRSLVPAGRGVPHNLLIAGRCISADHEALASCRVMAPCFALGEAAGTAAAMAALDAGGAVGAGTAADVTAVDTAALADDLVRHGAVLG